MTSIMGDAVGGVPPFKDVIWRGWGILAMGSGRREGPTMLHFPERIAIKTMANELTEAGAR
ncbi:hypothetical protein BAE30_16680 [Acidithiobacillus caldus]|uniref:Uncharacterized protein n=1 Tax=Acidithiobacillus caldus TaxID=33059 RepID=A0A1E7YRL2_9PROT|nr:hypothetical protein BAE30_16680 [Acidithiobacillus caldus]